MFIGLVYINRDYVLLAWCVVNKDQHNFPRECQHDFPEDQKVSGGH